MEKALVRDSYFVYYSPEKIHQFTFAILVRFQSLNRGSEIFYMNDCNQLNKMAIRIRLTKLKEIFKDKPDFEDVHRCHLINLNYAEKFSHCYSHSERNKLLMRFGDPVKVREEDVHRIKLKLRSQTIIHDKGVLKEISLE